MPTGEGLVGGAEFEVQVVGAEGAFGGDVGVGEKAIFDLAVFPFVGVGAVEEDDGICRWLFAEGRALAFDAGEGVCFSSVSEGEFSSCDGGGGFPIFGGKGSFAIGGGAGDFGALFLYDPIRDLGGRFLKDRHQISRRRVPQLGHPSRLLFCPIHTRPGWKSQGLPLSPWRDQSKFSWGRRRDW